MPDAFFQKKRKRSNSSNPKAAPSSSRRNGNAGKNARERGRERDQEKEKDSDSDQSQRDEDGGADTMDLEHQYDVDLDEEEETQIKETPAQARVRLAKLYLNGLGRGAEAEGQDGLNDADLDRDAISARLQSDASASRGKMHIFVSSLLALPTPISTSQDSESSSTSLSYPFPLLTLKGHSLTPTSALLSIPTLSNSTNSSSSEPCIFTSSKSGDILHYRLKDGKLIEKIPRVRRVVRGGAKVEERERKRKDSKNEKVGKGEGKSLGSKKSGAARRRARELNSTHASSGKEGNVRSTPNGIDEEVETNGFKQHSGKSTQERTITQRLLQGQGHTDEIWALAISSDGKHLVSGGVDKLVSLWSLSSNSNDASSSSASSSTSSSSPTIKFVKHLTGHRSPLTSLAFRQGHPTLLTASMDRTLKLFDVSQGSYIETLFGHQEGVLDVDCLRNETAVSAGGRERTARWWKIPEESQLVFRGGGKTFTGNSRGRNNPSGGMVNGGGKTLRDKMRDVLEGGELLEDEETTTVDSKSNGMGKGEERFEAVEGSIECVAMIDDSHFLSGGDSGSISLWDLTKKKPIFSHAFAHGVESSPVVSAEEEKSSGGAGTRHAGAGGPNKKGKSTQSSAPSVYNSDGEIRSPRAIVSIACLPYGDVFASGSYDGSIRIWSLSSTLRNFSPLFEIPVTGFVNCLQLISPSKSKWERGEILQVSDWPSNRIETNGIPERSVVPKKGKKILFAGSDDDDDDSSNEDDEMERDSVDSNSNSNSNSGSTSGSTSGSNSAPSSSSQPRHSFSDQVSLSLPVPTGASRAQAQHAPPLLIAAVGQEHRLGRWRRIKQARNLVMVVPLLFSDKRRESHQEEEEE